MIERLRRALPALIGLILFLVALNVLSHELRAVTWRELSTDVWRTPARRLGLALLLTTANYVVLTAYDFLAFAYIGKRLPAYRIFATSFLAYAIIEQHRVFGALRGVRPLSLLHAVGGDGGRIVPDRLFVRRDVLAGIAVDRRAQPRRQSAVRANWTCHFTRWWRRPAWH